MSVVESSLPGVLRERASFQPNDKALTFIDTSGPGMVLKKL